MKDLKISNLNALMNREKEAKQTLDLELKRRNMYGLIAELHTVETPRMAWNYCEKFICTRKNDLMTDL